MPKKVTKKVDTKDPVMDVARPGKTEPDASSRPIIVTRKPVVQDPMVKEKADDLIPGPPEVNDKNSRLKSLKRSRPAVISISSEGELKQDNDDKPAETKTEKPKPEILKAEEKSEKPSVPNLPAIKEIIEPDENKSSKIEEPVKEPAPEPEVASDEKNDSKEKPKEQSDLDEDDTQESKESDDKKDDTDKNSDDEKSVQNDMPTSDGIVDELAKQAVNKSHKEQEDKEKQAETDHITKLADEKKYALPIGQVTRKRNARNLLVVLLIIILLLLIGANFAIDAGLVKTNIKPITDVFPN